jgi:hypothetical protein
LELINFIYNQKLTKMKKINLLLKAVLATAIVLLTAGYVNAQHEEIIIIKEKDTIVKKSGEPELFRGGIKVEQLNDDTTVVYINKNHWGHMGKNHGPFCHREGKYNGHWAGIELGWNGYLTPDFDMNFPADERYMDLNWSRSLMVNLNPIELNLNLVKNHFGLTSGIGFSLNNYYFTNSTYLEGDSATLVGHYLVDDNGIAADMKVNKLFVGWLNVPVIFEYQTRSGMHLNSFHVGVGIIGGVKLGSYTKMDFYARNTKYNIVDADNTKVGELNVGEKSIRHRDPYEINPFKVEATARIGWSFLNLWGTYSLTTMFRQDKGPELYPYTVGITLLGW